ncbi:MAG TPA: hypothetical protein VK211_29200 [Kamptonema sp.]|nr:hypothetical protein [Kamptonema sp.]
MNAYEFAKKWASHGAYITKRGAERELVVFLSRCPKCGKKLPGMLSSDGLESCIESKCNYQRYPTTFY